MSYPYQNNVAYNRNVRRRQQHPMQTNPIYAPPKLEKLEISPEFMSAVGAEIYKNHALGNMLTKNPLKYGMNMPDYGASLMKQGKIPEKDFYINDNSLTEINKRGERFKETNFFTGPENEPPIIESNFYNSYTQDKYKTVRYTKDGEQVTRYDYTDCKDT